VNSGPDRGKRRELVDVVLRVQREAVNARSQGTRPERLPRNWGRRWRSAEIEQRRVADVSRLEAQHQLRSLVNHLGLLELHAPWFRDPVLRNNAISETLLWSAQRPRDLPSKRAQLRWEAIWRVTAPPSRRGRTSDLTDSSDLLQRAHQARDERQQLLAYWREWVLRQS